MATTFQVIALSSFDPGGNDTRNEPTLFYPDALTTAQQLKAQGKAFRIYVDSEATTDQLEALRGLGALVD